MTRQILSCIEGVGAGGGELHGGGNQAQRDFGTAVGGGLADFHAEGALRDAHDIARPDGFGRATGQQRRGEQRGDEDQMVE